VTEGARLDRGGRPAVLALDLGATRMRAAAVTADGSLHGRTSRLTPVGDGPDAVVAACIAALEEARTGAVVGGLSPAAVAIAAPGPIDANAGLIVDPPNMGPRFRDIPVADPVAAALGLPTVLDRDTQVAILAEGAHGAARGCRDFIYLTVSTGIGGAIVSDGRLIRGPDGGAGELGHTLVDRNGPLCGCGARGHLEAISSGTAIARSAREAGLGLDSAEAVARAAAAGNTQAAAILADAAGAFALACVALVDVFNPERIVVGGSLGLGQGERWLGPARDAVAEQAFRMQARRVEILAAALGDDVGLVGGWELVATRRPDLLGTAG
jgi:glucokinase